MASFYWLPTRFWEIGLGAWLAMGENDKAIVELNEFLRLAPDDPGAEVERQLVEALQKSQ